MELDMLSTVAVSEIFGPTLQGEGPDIGKPCLFLRFHHCPVQCPGCDTSYTWNGTEGGKKMGWDEVEGSLSLFRADHPKVGLVVTGGEPLLHYRSQELRAVVRDMAWAWSNLETSGYAGKLSEGLLGGFLTLFTSVSVSPKVTPCLHGRLSDGELESNLPALVNISRRTFRGNVHWMSFKFVVRDEADVEAVLACASRHRLLEQFPVYLMPYGNERDEILRSIETLIPASSRYGFIITPRLQALIWGKRRGV